MDAERARKVEALYESAFKLESARRAAFLAGNCQGDESLRLEVESLLQHDEDAGRFLEIRAWEMLAEKARLTAGERVSHYEIQEKLGEGGMGVVYKARDARLGRHVALKFVKVQFSERWEGEARAIASLNHPHIATLYDVGQHEGAPYLVMEYVVGRTLDKLIPRHGMHLNEALKIAIQVAGALTCAHSAGIIHRDLKPSNLMVDETGQVKVLDFGLAKLTERGGQQECPAGKIGVETGEGTIAGTPAYMSPEQVEGKPADARSDIFSFGSLLYEMVTGRPAFKGDSRASMMAAVLDREPEPISPELPTELAKIIGKCLRKDPERRFQHMDDVKGALEDLLDEVQAGKRTAKAVNGKPAKRVLLAIGGAAILLAVLLFALNVGGMRNRLLTRKPAAPLDSKRVAVAIFENRTGDLSMDNFGKMTAESVSEGLQQIPTIAVVPSSTVFELPASAMKPRALAEATRAGTIVSGATYLQGQTIQVQATIMDIVANKPLYPVEPASAPREKAMEVVESVRKRVLDVVAARYFVRFNLLVEEVKPPPFEAQKELAAGFDLILSDPAAAMTPLKRSMEIDPQFAAPGLLMAMALRNTHRYGEVTAQLDNMEKTHDRLTLIMRRRVDLQRANNEGRIEDYYSAARDIARLSQGNQADLVNLALGACWVNRPREAIENFKAGREGPLFQPSSSLAVYYLGFWTGALHVLGEHEEELKEARWARSLYPHILNVRALEARALVALGRIDEMEKLVDEITATSSGWVYTHCCVPHGTPGYVMLSAAEELRAHDHREGSLKMAGRAVDWYRSRAGEESRSEDTRSGLGIALYEAERWEEARAVFATLAARIFALLGDKEGAVALLREALAQGWGDWDLTGIYGYGFAYSHFMDLEPLHGYPPFEDLIRLKD